MEYNMKIAVCDDERIIRDVVYSQIMELIPDCEVDTYENGSVLLESGLCYDLYFLDVDMPGINGMDIAERIFAQQSDSLIVFLTGHTEYMPEAFKVRAFRFLCKPLDPNRFAEALYSARKEITEKLTITIHGEHGVVNLPLQDLICLEAYGDGVYLYTKDTVYTSAQTLREWMERLRAYGFYQVHRSYVVSLRHIFRIQPDNHIIMNHCNLDISVSRRNKKGLKAAFMAYVIEHAGVSCP